MADEEFRHALQPTKLLRLLAASATGLLVDVSEAFVFRQTSLLTRLQRCVLEATAVDAVHAADAAVATGTVDGSEIGVGEIDSNELGTGSPRRFRAFLLALSAGESGTYKKR